MSRRALNTFKGNKNFKKWGGGGQDGVKGIATQ